MSKIQIHSFDVSLEFWIFFEKNNIYIYIYRHINIVYINDIPP